MSSQSSADALQLPPVLGVSLLKARLRLLLGSSMTAATHSCSGNVSVSTGGLHVQVSESMAARAS